MGAGKSMKSDSAALDKYATSRYYLSRGASGNVYGPIPWQGSQLAIKQALFTDGKVTADFKKRIEAKKVIWTSLEHMNLMRIHWVYLTGLPKVMFIGMEYAAGGSLCKTLRALDSRSKLPITVVTDWAKQITDGMLYLHEKDIVHSDLKSSNILLMEPFDAGNPHIIWTLKIADFDEIKEHDHTATMSTLVGTCAYLAPEVFKDHWFSEASDVWSFGVVLWEMLSGDIPYKGLEPNEIMYKSISGTLDNLPLEPSFPGDFKLLLNRCWKSTCTERIPFHDISSILQRIDKYKSNPVLIETIRTKVGEEEKKSIAGLTILDIELFVVSGFSSEIEVYDSIKLGFSHRFNLEELRNPMDIASCSRQKCLYIFDSKEHREILRVDPNGKLIKKWSTGGDYGCGLSVTYESNIILTVQWKNYVNEYSPDGDLLRKISLSDAGIHYAWHAIKLTNGHFVVSHGFLLHIVNADGKLMKTFCGNVAKMNSPVHLSVDGNGFVLVADEGNHRVLLLDSNLEFKREILTKGQHGLKNPHRILLDESTNRVFVAHWGDAGTTIKIFQF